jgi:hypothetical protein
LAIHREANFKQERITPDQGPFLAALDSRPNVPRPDDLDILDLPEHRLRGVAVRRCLQGPDGLWRR